MRRQGDTRRNMCCWTELTRNTYGIKAGYSFQGKIGSFFLASDDSEVSFEANLRVGPFAALHNRRRQRGLQRTQKHHRSCS